MARCPECPGTRIFGIVETGLGAAAKACWSHFPLQNGCNDMGEGKGPFATIEEAIEEIRQGRMIVLVDDEDRENEGDLTMAAEKITPEAINFMTKFGRGLICLSLTEQRCDALDLRPISPRNTSAFGTPFCEPIDARARHHHRHQRVGSRDHDSRRNRSEHAAGRSGAAGARLHAARAQWRRAGARGADGSVRRSGAHRRARSFWRDLRNHERRRDDGARARS